MTAGRIPSVEGGIQPTLLTTTGDILYASSASNPARLAIGSSAQVLTVASGIPSWATPAAGGKLKQSQFNSSLSTFSRTSAGTTTLIAVTITPSAASSTIVIQASGSSQVESAAGLDRYARINIYDGTTSTDVVYQFGAGLTTSGNYLYFPWSGQIYLTSQGTSAKTYTLRFTTVTAGNIDVYQPYLIVSEIGA